MAAQRRARCGLLSGAILAGAAVLLSNSLVFVTGPTRTVSQPPAALAHPVAAASSAVLLASLPQPAHAGGMFDFGLTLPFVALTFLTMMAVLNALWYSPVTSEMDDRNSKLLQTLSEATDMLTKADEIQVEYTEQIRVAREKASAAVSSYRKETEEAIEKQLAAAASQRDSKAAEVKKELEEKVQAKISAAESEIEKRKSAFVKETLAAVSL